MIEIKQEYNYTTYLFTSPLWIDSNYEVTMNSKPCDDFLKLLAQHNIKDYKTTRTVSDVTKHNVVVAIHLAHEHHTQAFEYDLVTLLLKQRGNNNE